MSANRLPSIAIPEAEKRRYTEADVHAKLFEPDMRALGYPPRTSGQADGEYFLEQRHLALRRLKSGSKRGFFDGLYLIGNSPLVLCELKRYDELDSEPAMNRAVAQLMGYARSEDFERPPPFLLLYSGNLPRTRFFRLRTAVEDAPGRKPVYDELELWDWDRVKAFHLKGEFAEEIVHSRRLREILLHHLDRVEDDLRADVTHAVQIVSVEAPPSLLTDFGRRLVANPAALEAMRMLYQRKTAEVPKAAASRVVEEMVTQAALNYLNKVFF